MANRVQARTYTVVHHPTDGIVNRMQQGIKSSFDTIMQLPFLNGVLLEEVALAALDPITLEPTTNIVQHLLGRKYSGCIVVGCQNNASMFYAYPSANQAIATATWTTVECDTTIVDIGTDFDVATYTYTTPVNGIYTFNGVTRVNFPMGIVTPMAAAIFVGGSIRNEGTVQYVPATAANTAGTMVTLENVPLAADTSIVLQTYQASGGPQNLLGNSLYTRFSGGLVGNDTPAIDMTSTQDKASFLPLIVTKPTTVDLWVY